MVSYFSTLQSTLVAACGPLAGIGGVVAADAIKVTDTKIPLELMVRAMNAGPHYPVHDQAEPLSSLQAGRSPEGTGRSIS